MSRIKLMCAFLLVGLLGFAAVASGTDYLNVISCPLDTLVSTGKDTLGPYPLFVMDGNTRIAITDVSFSTNAVNINNSELLSITTETGPSRTSADFMAAAIDSCAAGAEEYEASVLGSTLLPANYFRMRLGQGGSPASTDSCGYKIMIYLTY